MTDDPDVNELRKIVDALRRRTRHLRDRVEELETENEKVRGRLRTIERVVDPDHAGTEYAEMTRAEKVYKLRVALVRQALDNNGTWAMDYNAVQALFNGYPSADHAYDLMSVAGDMAGFGYGDPPNGGGNKRVTVKIGDMKDETLIRAANKDDRGITPEEGA